MNKKFLFTLTLMIIAIVVCLILWIIAAIGTMKLTDGCLMRYNIDENGVVLATDSVSNTVTLKADGNYSLVESGSGGYISDESAYGKWLNTNLNVAGGQVIKFKIKGDVSLCKAYLPDNNLRSSSGKNANRKKIEIPRLEDKSSEPLTLYMDATIGQWRNLTELYRNDQYVVSILPDQKTVMPVVSMTDPISETLITADCREGKTKYHPICGRYSIWSGTYTSSCGWNPDCYECNCRQICDSWDVFETGWCILGWRSECERCGCYQNVLGNMPEPYSFDGKYTMRRKSSISELLQNFSLDCATQSSYILGDYQNQKYFWFSADDAAGLLYRFETSATSTNQNVLGSNFTIASIADDQSFHQNGENYQIILNDTYSDTDVGYLQFRLVDNGNGGAGNTGGYVLNIKQTKCRRSNGIAMNDSLAERGAIEYVIMPYSKDPNQATNLSPQNITVDNNGEGEITASYSGRGYLWLRIKNNPDDYKDSFGQYQVQYFGEIPKGSFFHEVLDPVFVTLKSKVRETSITIFKNMTCYKGKGSIGANQSNCTNFFNYIRGLLSLYIMSYGFMFLLGMIEIKQADLVIRIIKIALVAGLMNEGTFDFFNNYVFLTVTEFSDTIISNMSGYSMFTNGNNLSNPFMFLSEVLTKIFLSKTFGAQMMAMLAMGINGVLYFIIVFVTLIILIITAFRAIAIYIMAFTAIAVLIGIAPLFLTFMLFRFTFYLFDNWIKFTFRYMLEPIIMLGGVIVLTQLFTVYLDYAVGYSVCWKCALPIQIPFPEIPGFSPAFLNVPLFCINWFAPWGFDHFSGVMGINIQHVVSLMIIAYCLSGYIDFASKITGRIAGGSGGPSATETGDAMSSAVGQNLMKSAGLDAESRKNIKAAAKERVRSIIQDKGDKSGNRDQNRNDRQDGEASSSVKNDDATEPKKSPKPLPKVPGYGGNKIEDKLQDGAAKTSENTANFNAPRSDNKGDNADKNFGTAREGGKNLSSQAPAAAPQVKVNNEDGLSAYGNESNIGNSNTANTNTKWKPARPSAWRQQSNNNDKDKTSASDKPEIAGNILRKTLNKLYTAGSDITAKANKVIRSNSTKKELKTEAADNKSKGIKGSNMTTRTDGAKTENADRLSKTDYNKTKNRKPE